MSHDAQPLARLGVTSGPLGGPRLTAPQLSASGGSPSDADACVPSRVAPVLYLASDLGGSPTDVGTASVALAAHHVWLQAVPASLPILRDGVAPSWGLSCRQLPTVVRRTNLSVPWDQRRWGKAPQGHLGVFCAFPTLRL